tara:strand:+ start:12886 stop:13674 length:789 start_codon:yes stop_codon:yes gene_type:complete
MAFKADHLTKFNQLDRFVKQQRSSAGPRAGQASTSRTKRMIALGQSQTDDTKKAMRSSAEGIRNIFRSPGGDAESASSLPVDFEMASWVQGIDEDSREAQENRPKLEDSAPKKEKGVLENVDFDEGMIGAAMGAVADVESLGSGGYSAVGQVVQKGMYKGQRAYGKYQVMEGNIGPWTKKYYGKALTPQQFLENEEAQDAVLENELMSNAEKYGSIEDAVSVWFSGRPVKKAGNASDGYTTVPEYIAKFRRNYNRRVKELGE